MTTPERIWRGAMGGTFDKRSIQSDVEYIRADLVEHVIQERDRYREALVEAYNAINGATVPIPEDIIRVASAALEGPK